MDCLQAQPLFSELLEKALAPAVQARVSAHVAGCVACRKELNNLRHALLALRATPREPPPPGLLEAIVARAAVPPPPALLPAVPFAAPSRRWPWLLALAALLLLAVAFHVQTESRWRGRLRQQEADLTALREEHSGAGRDVVALREELAALRRVHDELRSSGESERSRLGEQLERWRAEAEQRDESRRQAEAALAGDRKEAQALLARVDELEKALALERARSLEVAEPTPPPAAPAAPSAPVDLAEAEPAPPAVLFLGEKGRIELQTRGPRHEVVPELLRLASEASSEELADLSLEVLEGLLGRPAPVALAREREAAEAPRWWQRPALGVAAAVGLDGAEPQEVPRTSRASREMRLRALKAAWERELENNYNASQE